MTISEGAVEYRTDGRVAYITLSRPERRNALNEHMFQELRAAVDTFTADSSVRVAILRGAGNGFSSGMDMAPAAAYAGRSAAEDLERLTRTGRGWLALWDCPKPIIAQVHGYCLAGAAQIPMFCDIVIIASDAVVGAPKIPLGAGWIGPMLAHSIDPQHARLFAYKAGAELTGTQAHQLGYAARVFAPDELESETLAIARDIARTPSDILALEKRAINEQMERQGFRQTVFSGAAIDSVAHTTATVTRAKEWIAELGLRAANDRFASEGM